MAKRPCVASKPAEVIYHSASGRPNLKPARAVRRGSWADCADRSDRDAEENGRLAYSASLGDVGELAEFDAADEAT